MTDPVNLLDPKRDAALDYPGELHPPVYDIEDRSEVEPRRDDPTGSRLRATASNVDDDDVAHFLLITADPGEPDLCGGCRNEWPCESRVGVEVIPVPQVDPEQERLQAIAVNAVREALGLQPL